MSNPQLRAEKGGLVASATAAVRDAYLEHNDGYDVPAIVDFLLREPANPASSSGGYKP